MKVSLMKLTCSVFGAALLMTSCLGDGESSFENTNGAFAYVTTIETGIKAAMTDIGPVASADANVMNQLANDQCYIITYKVNTSSTSSGAYVADYINVLENGNFIAKKDISLNEPYYGIDEGTVREDSINVNSIDLFAFHPSKSYYGDNWCISYAVNNLRDDDRVEAYFYYDDTNQKDEKGEDIGFDKNKIVIDVRFIKNAGSGSGITKTQAYKYVCNMKNLRYQSPSYGDDSNVNVVVKFRYVIPASGNTPARISYYPAGETYWTADRGMFLNYTRN